MDLSSTSTNDLRKKQRQYKGALIGALILMILVVVLGMTIKEKKATYFMPLVGMPAAFIPIIQRFQKINAELKSRAEAANN
ncbi:hypothetical protein ACE38W_02570 [Chitinophaga sp. Hz27]|uniref:hypothetical protein n=1 Tax=Chitinophaga sp. Hz27 TaxID=3347169 RepID=UPI0035E1976B